MDKIFFIVPAYNESENIRKLIDDWYPVVEKHNGDGESRLVIIDDGSKDDTYEIVKKCAQTRPMLVSLTKENGGHGATVLYGYRYSIQNKTDYTFQTDADGQTDPAEFEEFWENRKMYDAVIGNRSSRQDGLSRKFSELILLFILRITFGVKIPDSNAPFRLMKTQLLEKYINKMPRDYNLPNVMFTTYFAYFNEKIKFVMISFKPRQGGKNSINLKKIFEIGFKAVVDFISLKRNI